MNLTVLRALLAGIILAFAVSCTDGFPPEFPVPDFTLKSPLTGHEESLESIRGRPAIFYWFTSW
jgi:hypothetical protein